jgi:hypothetical protein
MDDKQRERVRKLKEDGTMDRLQQQLLADLLNDSGWLRTVQDSVRESARRSEGDLLGLTLEDLGAEIVPAGKKAVPDAVQAKIKALIQKAVRNAEKEDYRRRDD